MWGCARGVCGPTDIVYLIKSSSGSSQTSRSILVSRHTIVLLKKIKESMQHRIILLVLHFVAAIAATSNGEETGVRPSSDKHHGVSGRCALTVPISTNNAASAIRLRHRLHTGTKDGSATTEYTNHVQHQEREHIDVVRQQTSENSNAINGRMQDSRTESMHLMETSTQESLMNDNQERNEDEVADSERGTTCGTMENHPHHLQQQPMLSDHDSFSRPSDVDNLFDFQATSNGVNTTELLFRSIGGGETLFYPSMQPTISPNPAAIANTAL